ncbi:MAG TPA: TraR/DksA family transcriptional regulator [Sedimenticola sp.]|nr:TraR/DksA family transcriptional regulator [Sedimenticola sp.]
MESYLSEEQIKAFREKLLERKEALRKAIGEALLKSDDERYIELAGQVHDLEEASVADLLVDLNYAVVDHFLQEMKEVEAALQRIAEGSYGTCVACEGPVGIERLKAYPTARRCVECQQLYEKTHRQPGSPSL